MKDKDQKLIWEAYITEDKWQILHAQKARARPLAGAGVPDGKAGPLSPIQSMMMDYGISPQAQQQHRLDPDFLTLQTKMGEFTNPKGYSVPANWWEKEAPRFGAQKDKLGQPLPARNWGDVIRQFGGRFPGSGPI